MDTMVGECVAYGLGAISLLTDNNSENSCLRPGLFHIINETFYPKNHSRLSNPNVAQKMTHGSLIIFTILLIANVATICFHFIWQRHSAHKEQRLQKNLELDSVINELVRHFAPSFAVNDYRFKGMHAKEEGVSLEFRELGLNLKRDNRRVLDGVTGRFEEGKMVAVMGPSGCGKTTFLNTLCGKATYGRRSGTILINDGEIGRIEELKKVMGFVPQDDVVHETLTVREQIEFSAKLRNDASATREDIDSIVEDVLHVLQIEHIQSNVVGGVERRGISGGQRKRVNIGLELAACPVLLFLDEPTSGLDSTSSLVVVNSLKKMTELGMTIIMVIHQPRYSLFTLFDQALLLGKGGRTVYLGPAAGALPYFRDLGFIKPENENPADWLMDILSGEVENSKVPGFQREMLFDMWAQQGAQRQGPLDQVSSPRRRATERARTTDLSVVTHMVHEEWKRVTPEGDELSTKQLQDLIARSVGNTPPTSVVEDLIDLKGESGRMGKQAFEDFVVEKCYDCLRQKLGITATASNRSARPKRHTATDDMDMEASEDEGMALRQRGLQRMPPSACRQWAIVFHRRMVQYWRNWQRRLIDMCLISICALAMGYMQKGKVNNPATILLFHMGLALLITVSSLATFADRPLFWREAGTGISIFALFEASVFVNACDAFTQTLVYVLLFWGMTQPPVTPLIFIVPCFLITWVMSSYGYLISILVPQSSAVVAAVVLVLVGFGILGDPGFVTNSLAAGSLQLRVILFLSVPRWSGQMQFVAYLFLTGGIPYPESPDCSSIPRTPEGDAQVVGVLQGYLAQHSQADWLAWAQTLYAKTGLCEDAEDVRSCYWNISLFVLLTHGLLVRFLGFIALLHTSPHVPTFRQRLRSLCAWCGRGRNDAAESDDEGTDDSADS